MSNTLSSTQTPHPHPTTNQKNQPATREATSPNYHNPHNQTNPENVNHNNQEAYHLAKCAGLFFKPWETPRSFAPRSRRQVKSLLRSWRSRKSFFGVSRHVIAVTYFLAPPGRFPRPQPPVPNAPRLRAPPRPPPAPHADQKPAE